MTPNILQILDQLRKFMLQENGSWFSLFLYILFGLMVGDRLLERLLKYGILPLYSYTIVFIIVLLIASVRFFTRVVKIKKGKINIGIADLTIIHISDTNQLNYDQKTQLSIESSQCLYNQIQNQIFGGTSVKQLNLIKIPSRVVVSFENDGEVAEDLGLDILVRGSLKFVKGEYYLDYKVTCSKKVESWAFMQVVQSINSAKDIEFDLHNVSKKLEIFAKQLLWLGLLLHSTEDMAAHRFISAQSTLQGVIEQIEGMPARQRHTQIVYLFLYLYHFCFMRDIMLMKEGDYKAELSNAAQSERMTSSIKENFIQLIHNLKSYFMIADEDLQDNEQFGLEFLYALSRNPDYDRHDDAVFVYKQGNMLPGIEELLSGYFSQIEHNLIDAKLTYQAVLDQDHDNMVALRSVGIIEYNLGNYDLAKQHLESYLKNNTQHIFYRHYKDIRVLKLLSRASLRLFHPIKAISYYYMYRLHKYNNSKMRNKYVIF